VARILIIDDEAQTREVIKQMLERAGHHVEEAADGDAGLDIIRHTGFDLVITDILMPNKEGLETITELRRNYPEIKIIVMSGGGRVNNLDYLNVARMLGAQRALEKPIARQDMLEAVNAVLALD
jgi:CheY-like chemotaxis protein